MFIFFCIDKTFILIFCFLHFGIAVIPITDCHHRLLPVQFVVDPGEDFTWGKQELDDRSINHFSFSDGEKKDILSTYLDLIQVCR